MPRGKPNNPQGPQTEEPKLEQSGPQTEEPNPEQSGPQTEEPNPEQEPETRVAEDTKSGIGVMSATRFDYTNPHDLTQKFYPDRVTRIPEINGWVKAQIQAGLLKRAK